MTKTFIDWEAAAGDRVLVFFWDGQERPDKPDIARLESYFEEEKLKFKIKGTIVKFRNADFVHESDREKYTKVIKEHKYRPCKDWDEFSKFIGKIAVNNEGNVYIIISHVCFGADYNEADLYFSQYKLVHPINKSTIIGVEVPNDQGSA